MGSRPDRRAARNAVGLHDFNSKLPTALRSTQPPTPFGRKRSIAQGGGRWGALKSAISDLRFGFPHFHPAFTPSSRERGKGAFRPLTAGISYSLHHLHLRKMAQISSLHSALTYLKDLNHVWILHLQKKGGGTPSPESSHPTSTSYLAPRTSHHPTGCTVGNVQPP